MCHLCRFGIDWPWFLKRARYTWRKSDVPSIFLVYFNRTFFLNFFLTCLLWVSFALEKCGDGVVSFREYVMAISMLNEGSAVEKLLWSFKLYHKDSYGAITRMEMLESMQVCLCVCVWETESTFCFISNAKSSLNSSKLQHWWDGTRCCISVHPVFYFLHGLFVRLV